MENKSRRILLDFMRANLSVARNLSKRNDITFAFDDRIFNPLAVPLRERVIFPAIVNVNSPSLVQHLRMRTDMGAAWLRHQKDAYYKTNWFSDFGKQLALHAAEKARRELLLCQEYDGAAGNIIPQNNIKLFKYDRYMISLDDVLAIHSYVRPDRSEPFINLQRHWPIAQGLYFSLYSSSPSAELLAEPVRILGNLWAQRFNEATRGMFGELLNNLNNAQEFTLLADDA